MTITTNNPKYCMAALDLDGTLLHSNHSMSEATRDYLLHLHRRGFQLMIATGRGLSTVYEHIQYLGLPQLPVVCSNGARGLWSFTSNESVDTSTTSVTLQPVFFTPVPQAVVQTSIQLARQLGLVTQYYDGDEIYANPSLPHHYELTERYRELTGSKTVYVQDDFKDFDPPSKLLILCREKEQDAVMDHFQRELGQEACLVRGKSATIVRGSMGWFIEVLHPDVNKGSGLQKMCQNMEVPLSQVIAFGDGDNDYEFIEMAGRGIVMKNGRKVVKEVADQVIDYTNDQDGVMKTLQQLETQGCLMFSKKDE
jgi:Cof subfamily protein (haloacid dehalogenase superfamily)